LVTGDEEEGGKGTVAYTRIVLGIANGVKDVQLGCTVEGHLCAYKQDDKGRMCRKDGGMDERFYALVVLFQK